MYDPEAIEAMSTPELARLLDRLSERELKSVLIFMTGAAPRTVAHALNFVKDGGAETLVRQSGRAAEPAPVITGSEAAGMLAAAIITGTPVLVTGDEATWCPGTTFMEHEEVTLYCDRDAGHDGSHHAPGPDEGSEVAWSDEPAEPRGYLRCEDTSPAGGFTCTLKLKHEGLHSQLTPTGAFMAEWGYADGHVHTTAGHQPVRVTDDGRTYSDEPASVAL